MELKTKIDAQEGRQEIWITRTFDLPLNLLFRAYTVPELIAQWMGTKVICHENRAYGSYQFETSDHNGNVVFSAHGIFHEFVPAEKITRTFEMKNAPFGVQLEFLTFEALNEQTSYLTIQSIYQSVARRDQMLKLPFSQGLNMAHQRLQDIVAPLKS